MKTTSNERHDRRKLNAMEMFKTYVFPAAIAAITAYMSVLITINTLSVDIDYIKRDISKVAGNQIKLTTITATMASNDKWQNFQDEEIERLKNRVRVLEGNSKL